MCFPAISFTMRSSLVGSDSNIDFWNGIPKEKVGLIASAEDHSTIALVDSPFYLSYANRCCALFCQYLVHLSFFKAGSV